MMMNRSRWGLLLLFWLSQVAPVFAASEADMDIGGVSGAVNVVLALMVVLALVFILAWGMRRMHGVTGNGSHHMRVIAQVALSTRERLMLVEVAGEQLLLGVGAGGIRTLHVLEEPVVETGGPSPRSFGTLLQQYLGQGSRNR